MYEVTVASETKVWSRFHFALFSARCRSMDDTLAWSITWVRETE